jgi:hypothetical protein
MRHLVRPIAAVAVVLILAAPLAAASDGGSHESCSITCWWGGSCSASGPAPCSCSCTGFLGFGGPRCSCGGVQMHNPPADS